MKALTLKRSVYLFMAVIILGIVVFFMPFPSPEAEEADYSLKYDELTETQLQTLRVLVQDEVNSYLNDEQQPLSYSYEKHIQDFVGNDYIIYCFEPQGYAIYSLINSDFVEINPVGNSPYGRNVKEAYYVPMVGYYEKTNSYTVKDVMNNRQFSLQGEEVVTLAEASRATEKVSRENTQLKTLHTIKAAKTTLSVEMQKRIEEEPILSGKEFDETVMVKEASNSNIFYTNKTPFINADVEVPHSFYFKNNTEYAYEKNSCGYNALAMILVYHEIFSCSGYLSEAESLKYITPSTELMTPPAVSDSFIPDAVRYTDEHTSINLNMMIATENFLQNKDVVAYAEMWVPPLAGVMDLKIQHGIPVILFGSIKGLSGDFVSHAVTVYGIYNNGKSLVHYGIDNYTQVILSLYFAGGYFCLENTTPHKHNYRYFRIGSKNYCGCGKLLVVGC